MLTALKVLQPVHRASSPALVENYASITAKKPGAHCTRPIMIIDR